MGFRTARRRSCAPASTRWADASRRAGSARGRLRHGGKFGKRRAGFVLDVPGQGGGACREVCFHRAAGRGLKPMGTDAGGGAGQAVGGAAQGRDVSAFGRDDAVSRQAVEIGFEGAQDLDEIRLRHGRRESTGHLWV